MDNLLENLRTFMTIFLSVLLGVRNISGKSCRENQTTHFIYNGFFFFFSLVCVVVVVVGVCVCVCVCFYFFFIILL